MRKVTITLLLITVFGLLLRTIATTSIPAILNRDEAALAYNAFLLKETGQDEWGRTWPLMLESFGDYKLPGYPLILVGLFSLFGENDFIVRLPSILAGTALIPLTFWFLKIFKQNNTASLFGALLIAVSPVFLFYSRMAFEANVALSFVVLALCLLFIKIKRRYLLDLAAAIVLALAALIYNTPLLLLPIIAISVVAHRGIKQYKTWLLPVGLLGGVFLIMLSQLLALTAQKAAITVFSDPTVWLQFTEYRTELPSLLKPVIGNKYIYYLGIIITNTLQSLSPHFLLFKGGSHPWHSLPNWGHMYLISYGLAVLGILHKGYLIFTKKTLRKATLPLLLIGSLAPAVVTVDAPHTTRSLLFLFILIVFAAFGFSIVIEKLSEYRKRVQAIISVVLLLLVSSGLYLNEYFSVYANQQKNIYQTGFQTVLAEAESLSEVYIEDPEGYQYILTAWYTKMSAAEYFATAERGEPDIIGFRYGKRVGKYRFITNKNQASDKSIIYWNNESNSWELLTK